MLQGTMPSSFLIYPGFAEHHSAINKLLRKLFAPFGKETMMGENVNANTVALLCGLLTEDSHAVGHPQVFESLERDTPTAPRMETKPGL